ncbi:hypothetical protein COCNU_scaffold003161G000020 [Cocos nucifera]|nr:hypothetical protein [Cocos nucifera]
METAKTEFDQAYRLSEVKEPKAKEAVGRQPEVLPNATTYAAIKSLFQVHFLLGNNGLPLSTHSATMHAVHFYSCCNGTSISTRNHPIYKVKAGDGLSTGRSYGSHCRAAVTQ